MKLIDLHCDTIYKLMENECFRLRCNEFSVDLDKLIRGDSLAQTFALFVDTKEHDNPFERCMAMANRFNNEICLNSDIIALATNYKEIKQNENNKKLSALLSIEEGAVLEGEIENLQHFYDLGVRMMTLTWNHKNEIGYPHSYRGQELKGLTKFGFEVVSKMNELGMLIDVSHISDEGFYDVAKVSTKPFIATHSNSRVVKNHSRNLTDDMIRVLANRGGVTGINFYNSFLGEDKIGTIDDMIKQIKHIINIGGIDVVAIGTDFDGIDSDVEIEDISQMGKLAIALEKAGLSCDEIEKIYYKNALRVIQEVL